MGLANRTLRATPRVAPAAPSTWTASGGLCLLVPRPGEWAEKDSGGYTVPYVAAWSAGDPAVLRAAPSAVTAAAGLILGRLDPSDDDGPGVPPGRPRRSPP